MPIYRLINPSDAYTFTAPNLLVAGVAVAMLSTGYGAEDIENGETSPVLFGWDVWLKSHEIDNAWVIAHAEEIAAALDSFLIGSPADRIDVERTLEFIPPELRQAWLDERYDRRRSSMNDIGARASIQAQRVREFYVQKGAEHGATQST